MTNWSGTVTKVHLVNPHSSMELDVVDVDDRVSGEAITEMKQSPISLLVPESLKSSKETEYGKHDHVITFRQFFDDEVRAKRPVLILPLPGASA